MGKNLYTFRTALTAVTIGTILGFSGHVEPYPIDYFKSPLEFPLLLSGSFGELRSNHFHSGIDIKTNDTEGHTVLASADGWVSRIKVSPGGYGNALYVDHPNGYTTVYAHLQSFRSDIAEYVKDVQYSKKRFAIDVRPEKGRFPVEQGKLVALSGNSGGSTGPHLHFEIRRSHNSHPLNPQAFGIPVKDTTPPRIYRIKAYPADSNSFISSGSSGSKSRTVASFGEAIVLQVRGQGSNWSLTDSTPLRVHGNVKFAIQTHDYQEGSRSRLGATRVTLLADDHLVFMSEIEEFSFAETRYLNAHIDYKERQVNRRWSHRSHRLPGNRLPFYKGSNDGVVHVNDGATVAMQYVVEDLKGNTSYLNFKIVGSSEDRKVPVGEREVAARVSYGESATFARSGIRVNIPAGSLYEDVDLYYSRADAVEGAYSDVHVVHDDNTPVQNRMTVSILANGLPTELRKYALLAEVTDKGNLYSLGGEYTGGYVTSRVRSFGRFTIAADTTSPTINPLNVSADMSARSSIRFTAKDDLSGIQSYDAFIDDEWVLMEHDGKRNLFYHRFDEMTGAPGEHDFRFVVKDSKGNESVYETTFVR